MNQEISYQDHYDNYAEGWGIFLSIDTDEYQIQRVDDTKVFASDKEAISFVVDKALQESQYSRYGRIIKFLANYSYGEIGVLKEMMGENKLNKLFNHLQIQL